MGRYSAPQLDDDNEYGDQATAMDWDLTPNEDTGDRNHGSNGNGNGDSRSLIYYIPTSDTNDQGHVNTCSRGESRHSPGKTNHCSNNSSEVFLERAEQSNDNLVQHYSSEKKRRISITTIVAVALVSIVLKRHAPPPPPLWGQSPFSMPSVSTNSAEPSMNDDTPATLEITQHETWTSYSKHALSYGLSVAWYAISNAFCYAIEEVRDRFIEVLHGNGNKIDISLWVNWMKDSISKMLFRVETAKESQLNPHAMADIQQCEALCPIRLPAASNLRTHLFQGAATYDTTNAGSVREGWSTEEFLRQTVGSSLSPQNLALKVIAEGIDAWGSAMVAEAPVALVHNIATALSASPNDRCISEETLSGWILPPATGFLLVGPKGVGKLHTARRIAYLFLGHCAEESHVASSISAHAQNLEGVLEVIAGDYDIGDGVHPVKELIVKHIHSRRGIGGSVVIIHHIELLPASILFEIWQVLNGTTDTLSHKTSETVVEASCNGTAFVLTSKLGTKSIFRHIRRNVLNALDRESLMSSIIQDVDSHFDYSTKLASHTTVAPFLPFEQEDLSSILQSRIRTLNLKFEGVHWRKLEVSHATIKHAVGPPRAEYLNLYNENVGDRQNEVVFFTYSTSGAHALDNNPFWQTLRTRAVTEKRSRSGLTLKAELDSTSNDAVFIWCSHENEGVESCEEEWGS